MILKDKEIKVNRGDRFSIRLKHKTGNFQFGDKIKFSVVNKKNYNDVLMQKEFVTTEESEYFVLTFTRENTRFAEVKNKPIEFRYEIEYNGEVTLIGANDDEYENIFLLMPEAGGDE